MIISRDKLPTEFYLLAVMAVTTILATETVRPILPLYITEKDVTNFELGIIFSLYSFVTLSLSSRF